MEAMRSGKGFADDDDEEEEEMKREGPSTHKGKNDGKNQRGNTPRSKHSATEQRRRSKINERFQILRNLIPQSDDQKRDKASFLLEVIDYIQFLQEKVQKYESPSYQGWPQETMKLTPWRTSQRLGESLSDHTPVIRNGPSPGLMFGGKFDNNILANTHDPVEPDNASMASTYRGMDHHSGLSNTENIPCEPQLWQKECSTDCLSEQEELNIEGGTINISSAYSQGLLTSLTQALQSSGIDLSQASISVQIDVGKRAINRNSATTSNAKDHGDSEQTQKRFKIGNS